MAEIQIGDEVEYRNWTYTVAAIDGDQAIITTEIQSGPRNLYRRTHRVRRPIPPWGRGGGAQWSCPCRPIGKPHRDQTPRLSRGVIVAEGELCSYGGSMRYPSITWEPGTVLEVRDLPASLVRATIDNGEAGLVILDAPRQPADARPEPDWPGLVGRLQGTIANAGLALDRRDIEGARELFHDAQRRFIRIKD
jgi:hypothetical protein